MRGDDAQPGHPTGVGLDHWQAEFPPTRWSVLVSPDTQMTSATSKALCELSGAYWYPLYTYLRRRGTDPHEAQDLTQGFFAYLIGGDRLTNADSSKGRFRSYLLGALNHYVADVRDRELALKRGGRQVPVSIEQELAEERFQNEPSDSDTPETVYERQWALTVFHQAMDALRREFVRKEKAQVFELLKPYLSGEAGRGDYKTVAESLGQPEANIRSKVMRLRKRYRQILREQIETTVEAADDVDDEIRYLIKAMA